ncbi:MAG: VRR-NUC domain-containing protein [Sphaerochaetaceae bacterium]|nr:VRR-NUC domain-containing protein [Sphaerochaetaceae bacterium]
MLERDIEKQLVVETKRMKGLALKFTSPGFVGVPDRLILLPGGKLAFVEVKKECEKPRAIQISRHKLLRKLGFKVYVLDSKKQIKEILNEIYTS